MKPHRFDSMTFTIPVREFDEICKAFDLNEREQNALRTMGNRCVGEWGSGQAVVVLIDAMLSLRDRKK